MSFSDLGSHLLLVPLMLANVFVHAGRLATCFMWVLLLSIVLWFSVRALGRGGLVRVLTLLASSQCR